MRHVPGDSAHKQCSVPRTLLGRHASLETAGVVVFCVQDFEADSHVHKCLKLISWLKFSD